jgi:hypothetical protein
VFATPQTRLQPVRVTVEGRDWHLIISFQLLLKQENLLQAAPANRS